MFVFVYMWYCHVQLHLMLSVFELSLLIVLDHIWTMAVDMDMGFDNQTMSLLMHDLCFRAQEKMNDQQPYHTIIYLVLNKLIMDCSDSLPGQIQGGWPLGQ